MSRPLRESNRVIIHGPHTIWDKDDFDGLGKFVASEIMKPGEKVELFDDSGVLKWRHQVNLTAPHQMAFVFESRGANESLTEQSYAIGEFTPVVWVGVGCVINGILVTGASTVAGTTILESNGSGGRFTAQATPLATDNDSFFLALDTKTTVAADTRIRLLRFQ